MHGLIKHLAHLLSSYSPQSLISGWVIKQQLCLLCCASLSDSAQTFNHLCSACIADLPHYVEPHCPQCALPTQGELCGHCLQHPPSFDCTYALFRYQYPLDHLLHHYKYQQQLSLVPVFSQLILNSHINIWVKKQQIDALIAMPMHRQRLKQRGFNHVHTLAKQLNQHWQFSMPVQACQRIKDTPTQAGLNLKQRVNNLKGAFATNIDWRGKHILLLDDVMTTGASLNALALAFKKAGATRISCVVLARTLKA